MIASALEQYADTVILGARDVSKMPFRSRFGNTITRSIFHLLTGLSISDTQTRLRGIPANLIRKMMTVAGERYEYEINMLLAFKKWDISFVEMPIQSYPVERDKPKIDVALPWHNSCNERSHPLAYRTSLN
jgi:hypothetical protein